MSIIYKVLHKSVALFNCYNDITVTYSSLTAKYMSAYNVQLEDERWQPSIDMPLPPRTWTKVCDLDFWPLESDQVIQ